MSDITIRQAEHCDIEQLLQIYSYYVTDTAITFEYDVPSLKQFTDRYLNITEVYPYIIAEIGNVIVGYAYASRFHERKAYDRCAEITIYVDKDRHGQGIGKMLYSELERILRVMNITNMYACIAVPEIDDEYLTRNSIDFHEHLGYQKIGEFHKCGYKFGRWYNMVWAEKLIGHIAPAHQK